MSTRRGRRRFTALLSLAVVVPVVALVGAAQGNALAADASYRTLASASNPDWMRSVPDGTSLAAMSIPGTHESMSIHGGGPVQTQEDYGDSGATLAAQFDAGIRMVDIRVRINHGNTFTVHHGVFYQVANFDDVLDVTGAFLDRHPGETVLMRLKHECTGEIGSCRDVGGQRGFTEIFNAYRDRNAAARTHLWGPSVAGDRAAATPTLGTVRGKIVLAVLNGPRGGAYGGYGLAQFAAEWRDGSSTYVQDDYNVPVVGAIATKRDRVRRHLDRTSAGDPTKMYVNFTSGAGFGAYPYTVAGGIGRVQGVNPFLLTYLNEGPDVHPPVRRTGMVLMDFPGGGLINKIISLNPR